MVKNTVQIQANKLSGIKYLSGLFNLPPKNPNPIVNIGKYIKYSIKTVGANPKKICLINAKATAEITPLFTPITKEYATNITVTISTPGTKDKAI